MSESNRVPSKRITMADFLGSKQNQALQTSFNRNSVLTDLSANKNTVNDNEQQKHFNSPPSLLYTVRATKKGGVPCVVESRKHHKVIVLNNVEGDISALLSALQKSLGTGGVSKGNSIEIQGEHHLEKVKKFCLNSGCVVGATKQSKADAAVTGKTKKKNCSDKNESTSVVAKPIIDRTKPLLLKEIKTMKPSTLKEYLAAKQLSTQGNKKELLARLAASIKM